MNIIVKYQMKFKITYQQNKQLKTVNIEANSLSELKKAQQYPSNVIQIQQPQKAKQNISLFKQQNKKEIYELFNQLNMMLESNINISEAITLLLQNKQKENIKNILFNIQNSIQTSKPIELSLHKYKNELGDTAILFLKLGLENGNLKESINSLVQIHKQNAKTAEKLKDIFTYPIILLISLFIAIGLIFIFVIPNFQYVFELLGDNIPFATKILLSLQDLIKNYLYIFLLLPFLLFLLGASLYQKYRLFFDKILILKIPVLSKLLQNYLYFRLFLSISIIVKSKYKFQVAVEHSKNIIKNDYVKNCMKNILKDIKNGSSVANAFENTKLFDDLTIRLLYTAQHTNNYEKVLKDITMLYKKRFDDSIKKFSSIIEPSIILLISLVVLWLVLAVMVPMWDISNAIS